jgi:hypothetical protein
MAWDPSYAKLGGGDGMAGLAAIPVTLDGLDVVTHLERRHGAMFCMPEVSCCREHASMAQVTRANMTIESNGHPSTTMPAMMLTTPAKIAHPRPGRPGSLIAVAVVATPRKMNPTAIQMANKRMAYP